MVAIRDSISTQSRLFLRDPHQLVTTPVVAVDRLANVAGVVHWSSTAVARVAVVRLVAAVVAVT